ncbi:MAG: type II toxin-antitoxin system PemK/MazF family toxin [Acidobacteria bacterium]|nr:type II toxin-antitoxin system PemK/MazF family toxin [Acidobacteriota bacterium]
MILRRGQVWWADLGTPRGSSPGYKRPVVVVQADKLNKTNIKSVIVVISTTNLRLAKMPGNVFVERGVGGLRDDAVINVTQVFTLDKLDLLELLGTLPVEKLLKIDAGLAQVFSLDERSTKL